MIKTRFPVAVTLLLLLASAGASAGSASNVTITQIEIQASGHFFIWLSSPVQSSPACANQPANALVIDSTTTIGKAMMSVAMELYALNKPVSVLASGLCDVHAGYETMTDIYSAN
jgi:hypothetical protein